MYKAVARTAAVVTRESLEKQPHVLTKVISRSPADCREHHMSALSEDFPPKWVTVPEGFNAYITTDGIAKTAPIAKKARCSREGGDFSITAVDGAGSRAKPHLMKAAVLIASAVGYIAGKGCGSLPRRWYRQNEPKCKMEYTKCPCTTRRKMRLSSLCSANQLRYANRTSPDEVMEHHVAALLDATPPKCSTVPLGAKTYPMHDSAGSIVPALRYVRWK